MKLEEVTRIIETVYHNKYKLHTTYLYGTNVYGTNSGYAYKIYRKGRYIGTIADVEHTVVRGITDVTVLSLPTDGSYNIKSYQADVLILRTSEELLQDLRVLFKMSVVDTPFHSTHRDFYIEDVRRD